MHQRHSKIYGLRQELGELGLTTARCEEKTVFFLFALLNKEIKNVNIFIYDRTL